MRNGPVFDLVAFRICLLLCCAIIQCANCQDPVSAVLPVTVEAAHDSSVPDWRVFLRKTNTPLPAVIPVPTGIITTNAATGSTAVMQAPAVTPQPEIQSPATNEPVADTCLITNLTIRGDADLLDHLGISAAIRSEIVGKSLSEKQILGVATRYQERCTGTGYYLARIKVVPADFNKGAIVFDVDKGRIGRMSFFDGTSTGVNESENKLPFDGRYYSEAQLRRQLRSLKEEETFDYNDFYRAVFSLNAHPDVKMDSNLLLRKDLSTGTERRYADMEFYVREGVPFHGVLEVKNTGTDSTDEWRSSITLQHLNLTRHNDILTINTLSSADLRSLLSFAASYYRPVYIGNGGALTVYGGYSDVTAEEIVPEIDLIGTGWFTCLQLSYNLISNNKHLLGIAVSATYRTVESKLSDPNCDTGPQETIDRVTLIPMTVALNYSSGKPDRLGGRTFLTSQTSFNASTMGGSDSAELAAQRMKAEANYVIERLQAARLQPLFGHTTKEGVRSGEWILFLKADGQLATGPLIPAEQKAAGGMDSVRGYQEREALGDDGVSGTIELRTPLIATPFSRLSGTGKQDDKGDIASEESSQVQFVAFLDGAHVSLKEDTEGSVSSQSLAGAGLGVRFAVTSHFQFRFDWGFPLTETATSESSGRAHVSVQGQF